MLGLNAYNNGIHLDGAWLALFRVTVMQVKSQSVLIRRGTRVTPVGYRRFIMYHDMYHGIKSERYKWVSPLSLPLMRYALSVSAPQGIHRSIYEQGLCQTSEHEVWCPVRIIVLKCGVSW
jgi:hypothetical protein